MEQKYKSNRSDKFREWLKDLDEEKIMSLVNLERYGRLLIHTHDLTGDIDGNAFHGLARSIRKIQASYES